MISRLVKWFFLQFKYGSSKHTVLNVKKPYYLTSTETSKRV